MEATIALVRENAPFAVMLLLAVIYLDRGIGDEFDQVDARLDELSERMTGLEATVQGIDRRPYYESNRNRW
ncbi:MAG: hypothetical protein F4234_08865 [Gammaproteobacteria bacterium]|nr:hypothetical protein [Gammaproteobacteria bacterium]MYF00266.1 hypothetical protein [Gammaproteobacteria bacterium]MYH45866.1 hypothetical protein [Gammaproteobacteria bacterium]MYL12115.1 hypothetical protein [Gammaproteobacteria bacterium]